MTDFAEMLALKRDSRAEADAMATRSDEGDKSTLASAPPSTRIPRGTAV